MRTAGIYSSPDTDKYSGMKRPAVMRVVGIDPGIGGACVLLENRKPIEWARMPVMAVGVKSRINAAALAALLRDWRPELAVIELVGAMPGQGVSAMFSFGHAAGVVDGVVAALGIPVCHITPQAWKKRARLLGKDKDAARSAAIARWPTWRALDKKGEGQALADAALMALHGGRA